MLPTGVSVVIPVYNSEDTLKPLIDRIETVLGSTGEPFEIVMVNDGSTDAGWEVITEIVNSHRTVRALNLLRNYGQHNALLAGIRAVRFDKIVTLDDDLQNPPEEIPKVLEKLDADHDVVYGSPDAERHGILRDLASQVTKLAFRSAMNVRTARHISAFRAFRTHLREAFRNYHGPFPSIDVLLTWATKRFTAVTVTHEPRGSGTSHYTFRRLVAHALNMATGFSAIPLRVANILGFAFTLFGVFILLYVVGRYLLFGTPVQGFTFLASIITIFSGVQLFTLGIFGEYLARMHFRLMERPVYAIAEMIENAEKDGPRSPEPHRSRPDDEGGA